MELKTNAFRARFAPEANNFVSLVNLATGDDYIKAAPRGPLVELYALADGEKKKLLPGVPGMSAGAGFLEISYTEFGGLPIGMTVRCTAENDRLCIRARMENHSAADVVEVLMPHIGGVYLGEDYADDAIIYPHHAGERTRNPVMGYGVNKKDFWRASSVAFGDIYRREINYCGLASMSWMYYYDAENGLYIGSHDARFPVTGVIAETSGSAEDPWMAFGFRKHYRVRPGESYETGEYILAVTTKDWHYGAQLYRAYIAPYLDFDHNPAFLADECALNQCYNFKRTGNIEHTFRDIPQMYEEGAAWGVRHMFLASWNRTGFDSFYPEYYPDMELGSAMEFRRGLEYVREHGGFSTLYINARIFDVKSDFHKTVGEKMAVRNEKGEPYRETYGPEHFTVNCPSDTLWRDYLLDTAEFCVKAYGCDGIYLDQLASAEPFACYCAEHSHENIGEFNNGYVYVLRELLRRLRKHNPNAYIMTENCGDIYGSYTWGNLTWNGAEYDEYYNVFKYTFPEFVQVNMVNPRGWETEDRDQRLWFYRDMHRAVPGGHEQVQLLVGLLPEVEHGLYPLARLHLQDVDDIGTLGGLAALRDLIALLAVDLAGVSKEQDIVVGRRGEHVHYGVLLTGCDALFTHTALALGSVLADRRALDVAVLRQGKDALLLLDEILDVQLVLHVLDLGLAVVAELVGNGGQFLLEDGLHQTLVAEDTQEVGDLLLQLLVLGLELLPVKTLQRLQAHIQNGLGLHLSLWHK